MGLGRLERWIRGGARAATCLVVLAAASLLAVGCGGSADNAGASGTPTLGFMTWRDPTGLYDKIVKRCNQRANGRWRVKQLPMGPSVDAAREQLTRRLGAGDSTIDMINLDVIWTAEFSTAGWIIDLTKRIDPIKDQYLKVTMDSATYNGKIWALPVGTNSALLYYRSDIIKQPPTTWEELAADVKKYQPQHPDMSGFIFQGLPGEGGTVDALEFLYGSGAEILSPDGKKAIIDQGSAAEKTFEYLHGIMKDKVAPQAVKTFVEEDTRLAFQNGTALFMRNWPYAYSIMNADKASKISGKFKVAPLPGFEGHAPGAVVGGQNYGITSSSKHPELAWDAIACMGDEQAQIEKAIVKGELPVLDSLYSNAKIKKGLPFLDAEHTALKTARNRPITPFYNDITIVIQKAYNEVLGGGLTPKDAVKRINKGVQKALDGEAEI